MIENLRFDPGEEAERSRVRDEPHASSATSTSTTRSAPRTARTRRSSARRACCRRRPGRLLAREVEVLGGLLDAPKRPFVVVLGGVKVSDKLGVIDALLERCDRSSSAARWRSRSSSRRARTSATRSCEADQVEHCRELLATGRDRDPDRRRRRAGDERRRATTRHVRRDVDSRRLEGPRHRSRDRGHLRRRARGRGHGVVERPDGRVRDRAVRGRHAHGRRGGRRLPRLHRGRRRRQRGRGARRWVSPIASTTCRPAAARRSS